MQANINHKDFCSFIQILRLYKSLLMKYLVSIILFICSAQYCIAQKYTIKGSVTDTLNIAPLFRASVVMLRAADSVIEAYTRAGGSGHFELQASKEGKYILQITFPGFADYIDVVNVKNNVTDVGDIPMSSKEHLLKEFVLTKQIASIKIKGDTTEYMADSFKVKENANVEDLLRRLPGIQVDKNGQITAQGETVQKILVDGEEFFSDDPKVVTQGLQASAVEKVQVYDKKSDQADFTGIDDGQKTKTINLELKENRKKGYFGKAEAGGGTDGYFQNQGMINAFKGKRQISVFGINSNTDKVGLGWGDNDKFGGGNGLTEISDDGTWNMIGGSYDDFGGWNGTYSGQGLPKVWTGGLHFADKWNEDKNHISGSYRYAQQNVEVEGGNTRQYSLSGDTTRINTEQKNQFSKAERHGIDAMYEWKIDTNTSLRLTSNAGIKSQEVSSVFHTETWNMTPDDGPKTINDRNLTGKTNSQFINSDLLFRKKFSKKGRTASLDVKENYRDSKGDGHLNSSINTPGVPETTIDQKKINNSNTLSFSSKATYTEPLSKTVFLELDYGLTTNNSESLNSSYDKSPGGGDYSVFKDSFSSNYKYNVLSNQGGVSFKYDHKKMNFSLGSDVTKTNYLQTDLQHGDTSLNYNYVNLFPKGSFNYKFAKRTSLNFSYNGSTKQPTIGQIQPLSQNTDPLNLTIGNPGLKQSFTNRLSLRYNDYKVLSGRWIYSNLNYSATANDISTSQTINGPVSSTKYVNVNGDYSASGYLGYGSKIKKLNLDVGLTLEASTNHVNNFINNEKNTSNNNSYTIGPNVSYYKEDKYNFSWSPEVTYNDNTSTINKFSTNYWVFNNEIRAEVQLPKKFEVGSTANVMIRQQTVVFNTNNQVTKWNAYVTKKFLKKNELELKATIYDILNQNIGYTRTAQGSTISQESYNTIRRYFMLSLVWNITHTPAAETEKK